MIYISADQIREVEIRLGNLKEKVPSALQRALNRAASNVKTNLVKQATEQYTIKAKDVRETIKIYNANTQNIMAVVESKGRRIPLINFNVRPRNYSPKAPPKVLQVEVKRDGLKSLHGAFINTGKSGKQHVLKRTGESRYPIHIKYGPSVPEMLGNKNIKEYVEQEAYKMLDKRIEHEINRLIERSN